jgi:transposase-like protein
MVHHRQKKIEIGTFFEEAIREAVQLVQDGMSIRKAARIKGFKYPTLFRYVCKRKMYDFKMGELKFRPNYECRKIFSLERRRR